MKVIGHGHEFVQAKFSLGAVVVEDGDEQFRCAIRLQEISFFPYR
jgi:hypothetical protein